LSEIPRQGTFLRKKETKNWLYAGIPEYPTLVDFGLCSGHTENVMGAENQQETSNNFYYSGFSVGELSCSILKLHNRKSKNGGIYYTPDLTISNADKKLLHDIDKVCGNNLGVITKIKGGFNLSFRGKKKVKQLLSFFDSCPPIAGDLTQSKIEIIRNAISVIESERTYKRSAKTFNQLEEYREKLKAIKRSGLAEKSFMIQTRSRSDIGYFLSGIFDAEGSVGMKRSGERFQPFAAIAMKDKEIIVLFRDFLGFGNIRFRPREHVYHWEVGSISGVLKVIEVFRDKFPGKLMKMKLRMEKVRRILNDYTPIPHKRGVMI